MGVSRPLALGSPRLGLAVAVAVVHGAVWACGSFSPPATDPADSGPTSDTGTADGPIGPDDGGDVDVSTLGPSTIVAGGLHALWEIACDEQAAFVAVEGAASLSTVFRIAEGAQPFALATNQYKGRFPVVDDTRVYWVAGSGGGHSYVRATTKATANTPTEYFDDGSSSNAFRSLTRQGSTLAFYASTDERIFRGLSDGGGGYDVTTKQGSVPGLALDGAQVYWLTTTGDVRRSAAITTTSSPETFLAGMAATSLAIANGELFFTSDRGELRALSTAMPGGNPRLVASGLDLARKLTLDAKRAFWVNTSTGEIATVAFSGGKPSVIGTGSAGTSIAVCRNAIWFTSPVKGDVLRIARKGG